MLIQDNKRTVSIGNKNTLTGPSNCKKITRHHSHLSLCDDFKYLQIAIFFEKQVSFESKGIFITNSKPKTKKIVRAAFEKNMKVSDFGLIQRPFREYLLRKNFFQKSGSVTFLPLQSPNLMQKIRKILGAASEKTALPTNQIITKNANLLGRRSQKTLVLGCALQPYMLKLLEYILDILGFLTVCATFLKPPSYANL